MLDFPFGRVVSIFNCCHAGQIVTPKDDGKQRAGDKLLKCAVAILHGGVRSERFEEENHSHSSIKCVSCSWAESICCMYASPTVTVDWATNFSIAIITEFDLFMMLFRYLSTLIKLKLRESKTECDSNFIAAYRNVCWKWMASDSIGNMNWSIYQRKCEQQSQHIVKWKLFK